MLHIVYKLETALSYTDGYFAEGVADTLVVGDFVEIDGDGN